jgi:hypothetical protein
MHRNKVIVELANKIARVAWKILTKPEEIYRWADARQRLFLSLLCRELMTQRSIGMV